MSLVISPKKSALHHKDVIYQLILLSWAKAVILDPNNVLSPRHICSDFFFTMFFRVVLATLNAVADFKESMGFDFTALMANTIFSLSQLSRSVLRSYLRGICKNIKNGLLKLVGA